MYKRLARALPMLMLATFLVGVSGAQIAWAAAPCTPTIVSTGGYIVDSFTATGTCTWTPPVGVTSVDVLVVGGGGGGGWNSGSGGSGGGVTSVNSQPITGAIDITVGTGGTGGGLLVANAPTTGGASSFGEITAVGGPAGLNFTASYPMASPGGVNGHGAGGTGSSDGASGHGSYANGGPGDTGVASAITGALTYYGGGGGGGGWTGQGKPYGGAGGAGGGGKGSDGAGPAIAGTANTGGGGGASGANNVLGGAGGSGIVIIRYLAASGDFTSGKNSSAIYRSGTTFTVTVQSASKVTFYANNKKIPGCIKIATTGSGPYLASCSWKPSVHTQTQITAVVAPNISPSSTVTLSAGAIAVSSRSGNR